MYLKKGSFHMTEYRNEFCLRRSSWSQKKTQVIIFTLQPSNFFGGYLNILLKVSPFRFFAFFASFLKKYIFLTTYINFLWRTWSYQTFYLSFLRKNNFSQKFWKKKFCHGSDSRNMAWNDAKNRLKNLKKILRNIGRNTILNKFI